MSDPTELNRLAVAARLCAAMVEDGNAVVAEGTRKTIPNLLLMIELAAPFNRAVLRYLGLRRVGPDRYAQDEKLMTIRPRFVRKRRHVAA